MSLRSQPQQNPQSILDLLQCAVVNASSPGTWLSKWSGHSRIGCSFPQSILPPEEKRVHVSGPFGEFW